MAKTKKPTQLSSAVFLWIAFGLGVIAVLMMFVPLASVGGDPLNCTKLFFDQGASIARSRGAWPAFIGFMLILLATLISGLVAFPTFQPSIQLEKALLVISTILFLVGTALEMLVVVWWCLINECPDCITKPGYHLYPGSYIAGVFSIIAAGLNIGALKLDL